jgi:hypothetical protein
LRRACWAEPVEVADIFATRFIENITRPGEGPSGAFAPPHRQRRPMPGLIRSGTRMPAPPGPNMLVGEHAQRPPLPACPRARRADRRAGDEGDFCRPTPLARKEATKRHPCCRSSLRDHGVSRIEMLTRALPELRPDASPQRQPEGARPSVARRSADMPCGLLSHQA